MSLNWTDIWRINLHWSQHRLNINVFYFYNIFYNITKPKFYSIHNIFLIGDSNTKHKEWCSLHTMPHPRIERPWKIIFDSSDFSQLIDEPPRFGNTCIDLTFTKSTFNVNEFGTSPKDNCFDHSLTYIFQTIYPPTSFINTANEQTVPNYFKECCVEHHIYN